MSVGLSLRAGAAAVVLAASLAVAATPALADNRVSLLLHNDSGCTATVEFVRPIGVERTVKLDSGFTFSAEYEGRYVLRGKAVCGDRVVDILARNVTLAKALPQALFLRRNAEGAVIFR